MIKFYIKQDSNCIELKAEGSIETLAYWNKQTNEGYMHKYDGFKTYKTFNGWIKQVSKFRNIDLAKMIDMGKEVKKESKRNVTGKLDINKISGYTIEVLEKWDRKLIGQYMIEDADLQEIDNTRNAILTELYKRSFSA